MNDDLTQGSGTPMLDALPSFLSGTRAPRTPAAVSASAPHSIFDLYPRGSDVEVLGALRFLVEVEGVPAPWLDARADLAPGAVDAILSGETPPSDAVVRRLCRTAGMSRWLFFLVGAVKYGADLGVPELQWLLEERRRALAADKAPSMEELASEATRLFFKLGVAVANERSEPAAGHSKSIS